MCTIMFPVDIKHRINNLSHSSEWTMQDISLSGYIFTHLRLVKIWPPAREIYTYIYIAVSKNYDVCVSLRREALKRWWNRQRLQATYRNLLQLFVQAGHSPCAKALCEVLRKKCENTELIPIHCMTGQSWLFIYQ